MPAVQLGSAYSRIGKTHFHSDKWPASAATAEFLKIHATFDTLPNNHHTVTCVNKMCVFSAAKPPKKHTLVLFGAAGGGPKKNVLFRTRYLELVCVLGFEEKSVNFLMRQGGKMGG